jgi:hypothetical protein
VAGLRDNDDALTLKTVALLRGGGGLPGDPT